MKNARFNTMIKLNFRICFISIILLSFLAFASCKHEAKQSNNETGQDPSESITLSEAQMQLANIMVIQADESTLSRNLELTGTLKVNEQSALNISARSQGRILKLFFKNSGETVHKGDSLYEFYSEDLVAAEREYFTLHSNNWNYSGKYGPSLAIENKLLLYGMVPAQIEQLKKDGKILFSLKIHSPVSGTIRSINITEGQYVNAGQSLFDFADNKTLWAEARAYTDDLNQIKVGMPVVVNLPAGSGNELKSNICFINPTAEEGTNLFLVRSIIDNVEKNLYPGMLALVNVQVNKTRGIIVPASAVITDKAGSRVWVRNEDGSFSAREVKTGMQTQDSILISEGLKKSEMVVTSGAYLLNSELILKNGSVTKLDSEI